MNAILQQEVEQAVTSFYNETKKMFSRCKSAEMNITNEVGARYFRGTFTSRNQALEALTMWTRSLYLAGNKTNPSASLVGNAYTITVLF